MLHQYVDEYIDQYERHFSLRSVEAKVYALGQFIQYLDSIQVTNWQQCDQKIIRNYIIYRSKYIPDGAKQRLTATSMQTQLASIRVFFDYLVERDIIRHNPAKLVKPPKSSHYLPNIAEVEVLFKILDREPQDDLEIRDRAICELLYSSGLRLTEITMLDLSHLDLREREILVVAGKGGKDRVLPLGKKAKKALEHWFLVRDEWLLAFPNIEMHAVFISKRGGRLTSRQISNRVKRYALQSGVNINLHPHLLRHSMATHLLETSQDIRLVQELLGHADISTTQVYTHLDFMHLTKVFDETHPRAKREKKHIKKPHK